jgi:hypothetical protein
MKTSIGRPGLPFLLVLAFAASPLFAASASAPPPPPPLGLSSGQDKLDALDAKLKAGDWAAAKADARALLALKSSPYKPIAAGLVRLALAEAALGEDEEAYWHWEAANALSFPAAPEAYLAGFGPAGAKLSAHPPRAYAEVPRGVEKDTAPGPGYIPARRVEGTVPAEDGARAEGRGPRWVRLQAVIDAQGRLRQPVVIGPDYGYSYGVLEAARGWKFEPAKRDGAAVAGLYEVVVNPPAKRSFKEVAPPAHSPGVSEIVDLLQGGEARKAASLAGKAWSKALDLGVPSRSYAATLMALRALASAEWKDTAICLWQAAQGVEPALYHLDLSSFGTAGELLDHNRFGEARAEGTGDALTYPATRPATGAAITRPELLRETQQKPYADGAVRFLGFGGQVVIEVIIDELGSLRDPVILSAKGGLFGFDLASLDALCHWRFRPASVNGKPVRTYYVLTTNLGSAAGAQRPPARP